MSRRKRQRGRRRRDRKAQAPVVPVSDDRPVNWSRLQQLFTKLSHRGSRLFADHVLAPIVVDAASPEEMIEATERAIIKAAHDAAEN